MTTFIYKAKNEAGETYEDTLEAESRFEVYEHIRREGGTALSVKKESVKETFDVEHINVLLSSVTESEKVVFTRNIAAMLEAGLPLSRALGVIQRQSKNPKLKEIVTKLAKFVNEGGTFNEALAQFPKVFSPLLISMVRAGEEAGTLPTALRTVSTQMDRALQLKKKIRGAMIYPGIILLALIAIGTLMLIFIVPTLQATFEDLGIELPASTQVVLALSDFLVNHTLLTGLIALLIVSGFIAVLRTYRGQRIFEFIVLNIPIIGPIAKEVNAARTTRTLASLLSSGVGVVPAFEITHDVVQNTYYKDILKVAPEHIQKGKPIQEIFAINEDLYPIFVSEMVAVGEETGKLPDLLTQVAEFYEAEVAQKTKDMSTVIEPFLMIVVGVVVGFFAVSMITPIYSITEGI